MKHKKLFLIGLLPMLMLASCNSEANDANWRKMVSAHLATLKEVTQTSYSIAPEGHIGEYGEIEAYEESYSMPTGAQFGTSSLYRTGYSFIFNLPVRVNEENFCPDKETYAEPATGTAYNYLKSALCYNKDALATMKFETFEDGSFQFYVNSVSKFFTFNHFYAKGGPESTYLEAYGRYEVHAYYNNQGLLTKETCKTVATPETDISHTVDVSCTYTYNE
jgi:hypothetical protein